MKQRPMIMQEQLANLTFEGLKTQTRRIKGLEKINNNPDEWISLGFVRQSSSNAHENCFSFGKGEFPTVYDVEYIKCPYGVVGDQLWIKQNYKADKAFDSIKPSEIPNNSDIWYHCDGDVPWVFGKTRPNIFMCRWMSRIQLEIISIRVERLKDISEEDAWAEGVVKGMVTDNPDHYPWTPKLEFAWLWNSIDGPLRWASNPWVWVVEFKRI